MCSFLWARLIDVLQRHTKGVRQIAPRNVHCAGHRFRIKISIPFRERGRESERERERGRERKRER